MLKAGHVIFDCDPDVMSHFYYYGKSTHVLCSHITVGVPKRWLYSECFIMSGTNSQIISLKKSRKRIIGLESLFTWNAS
jgi:hypothetical protein